MEWVKEQEYDSSGKPADCISELAKIKSLVFGGIFFWFLLFFVAGLIFSNDRTQFGIVKLSAGSMVV